MNETMITGRLPIWSATKPATTDPIAPPSIILDWAKSGAPAFEQTKSNYIDMMNKIKSYLNIAI